LLLVVVVHAANLQESDGAKLVLRRALGGWVIEIVARPKEQRGFAVLPRRWVVERTFAWLGRCRRLSKDYEEAPETHEAWVQIAMIHLMLKRLSPP
jgi:putative transposase